MAAIVFSGQNLCLSLRMKGGDFRTRKRTMNPHRRRSIKKTIFGVNIYLNTYMNYEKYLFFFLFIGFSCTAQQFTDLQEQGKKGNVKKMVIENYLNVPATYNKDSAMLYEMDIFYYNKAGNIDSTITLTGSGKKEDLKILQQSTLNTLKGQKQEIIYNYHTKQIDTVQYVKLSDSSYQKIIHNKINGQTTTTTYYLDADYLAYKMSALLTDSAGHTLLTQGSERYNKDSRGLYKNATFSFSDMDNGAKKKGAMVYSEFDKHENPGKVILTNLDKPNKIEMRIFEYQYY